jgi:hypothetical protein
LYNSSLIKRLSTAFIGISLTDTLFVTKVLLLPYLFTVLAFIVCIPFSALLIALTEESPLPNGSNVIAGVFIWYTLLLPRFNNP